MAKPPTRWGAAPDANRGRSPAVAAFLSFLIPGLGQAWAGQGRRGLLIALPVLTVGLIVGLVLLNVGGIVGLAGVVLQPPILVAILILDLALLVYRGWAIIDGYRVARGTGRPRSGGIVGAAVLAGLLLLTVAPHGLVAYVDWNTYDLVTGVFGASSDGRGPAWDDTSGGSPSARSPSEKPGPSPSRKPAPSASDGSPPSPDASPSQAPSATPDPSLPYWADDGRLNILLIGGDAGPGRDSLRTDSMILLTVDLETARAALVSVPRNLFHVPLPEPYASRFRGGVFPDYLNALWRYGKDHGQGLPGNDQTRGFRAISAAIGYITGVDIDGLVSVDLNGFVRVIDALGGLEINVPYRVVDQRYPNENGQGTRVVDIRPGLQRLDGSTTLAFARTRRQDSDYGRIDRQQLVLLALRKQLNPCTMLPRLPDLVGIAKETIYTNIAIGELPRMLALADRIDTSRIERLAFTPQHGYPETVTQAEVGRMRRAVRDIFKGDPPPPGWEPGPVAAQLLS